MTRRALRHLALAAAMTFAVAPGTSQQAVAAVPWPDFVQIQVTGEGNTERPQWSMRALAQASRPGVPDLQAQFDCDTSFVPEVQFTVYCEATKDPDQVGEGELERDWACDNPGVSATIGGPIPDESVVGIVRCSGTEASCRAIANVLVATTWRGDCAGATTGSPLPITCEVDLADVQFDGWTVTCYGTDP